MSTSASAGPSERGLRLLSIDGGGIRGLSALIMLKEVLSRIRHDRGLPDLPLPCDIFDLAGGTGTGGLIVLMLFRLRMSIDAAIEAYTRLVQRVFSEKKQGFFHEGLFKATRLEEEIITIIQEQIADITQADDARQLLLRQEGAPKCFVCAMPSRNLHHPTLFRSWTPRANSSYDCTIVQAARATTAAPIFFKAASFGHPIPQRYLDGGLRCNNPVKYVMQEARSLYPNQRISCLLSLGTGAREVISLEGSDTFQRVSPTKILKLLQDIAMDCEAQSEMMAWELSQPTSSTSYFRLNVDQGLQGVSLEEWRRLDLVTIHTSQYLMKHAVTSTVDQLVDLLREASAQLPNPPPASAVEDNQVDNPPIALQPSGKSFTPRTHHEIYYDELWKHKRGSPLWFPAPSDDHPMSYRQKGFDVGDVGILKPDKPFDFLFNIFLPADHPINAKNVPDCFRPCPLPSFATEYDVKESCFGSQLVSIRADQAGLVFDTSTSKSEGAILVLPQQAFCRNLTTRILLDSYLTSTIVEAWYRHAIKVRGPNVQNGDIFLVYGCDKATSWGLAAFSNTRGNLTSLQFGVRKDERHHTYQWVCTGTTNVQTRIGLSVDEDRDGKAKNQCVFLRTMNTRLSGTKWKEIQQRKVQAEQTSASMDCPYVNGFLGTGSLVAMQPNLMKSDFKHPSSVLNQCLLDSDPHAKVAITSDDDCILLMPNEKSPLLSSQQLLEQIQKLYRIDNKNGIVFLTRPEVDSNILNRG